MKILKVNSSSEGSCSECNVGLETNIEVNELQLGIMRVRLCDNCLERFIEIAKEELCSR